MNVQHWSVKDKSAPFKPEKADILSSILVNASLAYSEGLLDGAVYSQLRDQVKAASVEA